MTFSEMDDYIRGLSDSKLIVLCDEIYNWGYVYGELPVKSALNSLSKKLNYLDKRAIEYSVKQEAHRRYRNLVLLLMKDAPTHFLQQ